MGYVPKCLLQDAEWFLTVICQPSLKMLGPGLDNLQSYASETNVKIHFAHLLPVKLYYVIDKVTTPLGVGVNLINSNDSFKFVFAQKYF